MGHLTHLPSHEGPAASMWPSEPLASCSTNAARANVRDAAGVLLRQVRALLAVRADVSAPLPRSARRPAPAEGGRLAGGWPNEPIDSWFQARDNLRARIGAQGRVKGRGESPFCGEFLFGPRRCAR